MAEDPVRDEAPLRVTIRNAVIHMQSDQPLVADLFATPSPSDSGLLCTNLRTLAGKRPVFADDMRSVFFFPYHHIRFVEILPADSGPGLLGAPAAAAADEPDLEMDEDLLRRIREA